MSAKQVVNHPLFARLYSRVVVPSIAGRAATTCAAGSWPGCSGTVVEVGPGDGANFAHYPDEVERIVAVEPEPYLREKAASARRRAGGAARRGRPGLPVADGEADAVVFTLVLCSVDQARALAEARRVLRPGGELRFLEHVQAHEPGAARTVQRVLDATVWPRLFGGCHVARDTVAAIEEAGFTITELERFSFPEGARGPSARHRRSLGRARRWRESAASGNSAAVPPVSMVDGVSAPRPH